MEGVWGVGGERGRGEARGRASGVDKFINSKKLFTFNLL